MCGITAVGAQGRGCSSSLCHAHLKMGVLLHKQANERFILILAVHMEKQNHGQIFITIEIFIQMYRICYLCRDLYYALFETGFSLSVVRYCFQILPSMYLPRLSPLSQIPFIEKRKVFVQLRALDYIRLPFYEVKHPFLDRHGRM